MDAVVARGHPHPATQLTSEPAARAAAWSRPLAFGAAGTLGLLAFYLGTITLAQGWAHATEQLAADRWFVGAIVAGFGTQIGLFTHLRALHRRHDQHAQAAAQTSAATGTAGAAGSVAASTGTSTAAMLACCAHHVSDVLAVLGLSGAALFLNAYKTPLLWLGIAMNAAGALYLLRQIRAAQQMAGHPSGPAESGAATGAGGAHAALAHETEEHASCHAKSA